MLAHRTKLIVNLCTKVGRFGDWRDDCSQYWPKSTDQPFQIDNKLSLILLETENVCSSLQVYRLNIKEMTSFGTIKKEYELRLVNFIGWPDLGVPETEAQIEGFSKVIQILFQFYV